MDTNKGRNRKPRMTRIGGAHCLPACVRAPRVHVWCNSLSVISVQSVVLAVIRVYWCSFVV